MKIISDKYFEWLSYAYLLLIPISPFFAARLLVVLVALIVLTRGARLQELIRNSWDLLIFSVVLLLGMLYTADGNAGLKVLETSFPIIGTPIVFASIKQLDRDKLNRFLGFFCLGVVMAGMISLVNSFIHYFDNYDNSIFFFDSLTNIINSHPTYFAYFLILAITFGLYFSSYEYSKINTLAVVGSVFCFVLLLLTGGLTAFVSLLYVLSFFVLKFLLSERSTRRPMVFTLSVAMLITIILINLGNTAKRQIALDDSWDRFELWVSAINASPDYIFGAGTGGSKEVLNQYYMTHNHPEWAKENMNAHNQFIQVFFTHGVVGLAALLILLLRPIYVAFKHNDQLGILSIFPFLIYGMTEVFLGRFQGVVFFAMLHQLLIWHYGYSDRNLEVKSPTSSLSAHLKQ